MSNFGQKIIDIIRGKRPIKSVQIMNTINRKPPKTTRTIDKSKKIVAVSGFGWSGSSAMLDLLAEFKDVTMYGGKYRDYRGIIEDDVRYAGEVQFIKNRVSIFNLINSFESETPFEQDLSIKRFIKFCYDLASNSTYPIYNDNFIKICKNFLENILDLDDYTKEYMKEKDYSFTYQTMKDKDINLSFVYDNPHEPYIFYKFKKMPIEDFDVCVCNFLWDFFNNAGNTEILVLDQIFEYLELVDKINFYLNENPIK